jgi:hypothetical protein
MVFLPYHLLRDERPRINNDLNKGPGLGGRRRLGFYHIPNGRCREMNTWVVRMESTTCCIEMCVSCM